MADTRTIAQVIAEIEAALARCEAMVEELKGKAAQPEQAAEAAAETAAQEEAAEEPAGMGEHEMERFRSSLDFHMKQAANRWDAWQYAKGCPGAVRLEAKERKARFDEYMDNEMEWMANEYLPRLGYDAMWREALDSVYRVARDEPRLANACQEVESLFNRRLRKAA